MDKEQKKAMSELEFINELFGLYDNYMPKIEIDFSSFQNFKIKIAEIITKIFGKYPPFYDQHLKEQSHIFRTKKAFEEFKSHFTSKSKSISSNKKLNSQNIVAWPARRSV